MRIHSSEKLKYSYKLGDEIRVRVIERVDQFAWIVSLEGVLIQVRNSTAHKLSEGEVVQMRLVSLDPPQLSWL